MTPDIGISQAYLIRKYSEDKLTQLSIDLGGKFYKKKI